MKYQIYIKKEIKSDADFPKKEGEYIVSSGNEKATEWFFPDNTYDESHWREDVDWYLQPIELDIPDDIHIKVGEDIEVRSAVFGFKYLRDKIKNQLK